MAEPAAAAGGAEAVLRFWFGDADDDAEVARTQNDLWWNATAEVDGIVRERFGALHAQAVAGALASWSATPRNRLALILVLDQLSRHLYRDGAGAYAQDAAARRVCVDGLAAGADLGLRLFERVFFYMPLMHSEERADQACSVQLGAALAAVAPLPCKQVLEAYAEFGRGHCALIERFGRFPHRNAILGRTDTPQEAAYLADGG